MDTKQILYALLTAVYLFSPVDLLPEVKQNWLCIKKSLGILEN